MWGVSDRFIQALKAPHKYRTVCTITAPGGDPVDVQVTAGRLAVNGGDRVRRRITGFQIVGDSSVYELAATPGAIFDVSHGLAFGSSDELVPIIHGEALTPSQSFGDGSIGLTIVDLGNWLAQCTFLVPFAAAANATRVATITAVVTTAIPGVAVVNLSSDTGLIGSPQVWARGPGDVVADLTRDGGTEGYFRPDGVFVIRDLPTTATAPVWAATSGEGGTLISAARTRPSDRYYNTVVVRPSANDGSQTWAQQVATITDTTHPRHATKIGTRPLIIDSPTAPTAAAAMTIALQQLDRVLGTIETLALQSIANPALEANDSIRATTPRINTQPALTFQHFIDGFTLDLFNGAQSMDTRSQVVTDG